MNIKIILGLSALWILIIFTDCSIRNDHENITSMIKATETIIEPLSNLLIPSQSIIESYDHKLTTTPTTPTSTVLTITPSIVYLPTLSPQRKMDLVYQIQKYN
jgi:hypothetical protein